MFSRPSLHAPLNTCAIPSLLFKAVFFLILYFLLPHVKLKFTTQSIEASTPQTLARRVVYPFTEKNCTKDYFHQCTFLSTLSEFPLTLREFLGLLLSYMEHAYHKEKRKRLLEIHTLCLDRNRN